MEFSVSQKRHAPGGTLFCLLRRSENLPPYLVAVTQICSAGRSPLANLDGCPCSASAASAAGSASAAQSLLDKIERRTAHSAQRASHTLCAQFPWLCPIHPHMSAGWDFFDSLRREGSSRLFCACFCAYCRTERTRGRGEGTFSFAMANPNVLLWNKTGRKSTNVSKSNE